MHFVKKLRRKDQNKNVSLTLESDLKEMCKKISLFVGHEADPIKWSLPLLFRDHCSTFLYLFVVVVAAVVAAVVYAHLTVDTS